jgi:hypothetical protein
LLIRSLTFSGLLLGVLVLVLPMRRIDPEKVG